MLPSHRPGEGIRKGEQVLSPGHRSDWVTLTGIVVPDYRASLNAPVVRTNLHELAMAMAIVRLHLDKFGSPAL